MLKIILILAIIVLDQLTKYWAVMVSPCSIVFVLNFIVVSNPGLTFGLFPSIQSWIVWLGSGLLLLYILWELVETRVSLEKIAYSFIIGGAIGNLIDRFRLGHVIDFLDFHVGSIHYPWPFNVGDSFIVVGIFLLFYVQFFMKKKKYVHM